MNLQSLQAFLLRMIHCMSVCLFNFLVDNHGYGEYEIVLRLVQVVLLNFLLYIRNCGDDLRGVPALA